MVSDAQKQAQTKYDAANAYMVSLKLNRKTDMDIIEALEKAESRQGLIKAALREYLKVD